VIAGDVQFLDPAGATSGDLPADVADDEIDLDDLPF
jgi:hypothetical protein